MSNMDFFSQIFNLRDFKKFFEKELIIKKH